MVEALAGGCLDPVRGNAGRHGRRLHHGWAKVTYVVGITAPGAVAGWLAHREPARLVEPAAI